MTDTALLSDVVRLIREVMPELATREIDLDTSFEEIGMDSLNRVDLLAAAESEFDVTVPDDDVATFIQVRHLVDFVAGTRVG
ncbi:acyl carrier protein [Catellatospora sp. TT07R-123]|uniref:acyl carrier protein n=1 Tax=Catellatospora sp. TT07R-123 TaxID=2733863 RepID=UPI001BB40893|nr:acyl carrier protein [Catellatospora sp. TT07R-123]